MAVEHSELEHSKKHTKAAIPLLSSILVAFLLEHIPLFIHQFIVVRFHKFYPIGHNLWKLHFQRKILENLRKT